MVQLTTTTLAGLLTTVQLATAHFSIDYPSWRANSLQSGSGFSQWVYPCAGVPGGLSTTNRTDWPLTGGSLKLDLHHPWTYVFVNLGLGENVTNFNYTLTPNFWNETGNGTLCIPSMPLPADLTVTDGTKASLQVVTLGDSGSALYNCADITFRSNATSLPSSDCANSPGVSYAVVNQEVNGTTTSSSANGTTSGSGNSTGGSGTSGKNSGAAMGVDMVVMTSVVGLVVAFVAGMGL
ncbi:hypothetical protein QBC46DRAFT_296258 [Diplogelasinospora grovesii]|uniref:Copper acquisition factor BIM1-like domain-containing protein n=1 Tax=Diplogelasinospora grovesii TaxID=303347 RepID=A0AAN6N0N1_9PEZI|nr:hypothetical protein QBC46DRAFT_296258 [Diplogelasinospora grovesii]